MSESISSKIVLTPRLWARDHVGPVDNKAWRSFMIWCPACGCGHVIPTPRWSFNGRVDAPTFTPSVKVIYPVPDVNFCCHFNVTDGKIQYHGDCSHQYRGQLIDMAVIPELYGF